MGASTPSQRRRPRGCLPRWLFWTLLGLFVFHIGARYYFDRQVAEMSYSEFKAQLADDNIESLLVRDTLLTGEFRESFVREQGEETVEFESFSTHLLPFEDPSLWTTLSKNGVEVTSRPQDSSWVWWLLFFFGMLWLLSALSQAARQRASPSSQLLGLGRLMARTHRSQTQNVTFADVAGLKNAKNDLLEIVKFLKEPEVFRRLGAQLPKGVLLMGPPGTGKTLLARAVAGEAEVPFFSLSASQFVELFVGVGASRVRELFQQAKKAAPSIIFVDEIDSVGRSRSSGAGMGHDEREQTLNQLLAEMDGFEPNQEVVVLAATNRPDILDEALLRPGRFDRKISVELPQRQARRQILRIHSRGIPVAAEVDLDELAARTVGASGADLKNLVNEAALLAARAEREQVLPVDFERAYERVTLGYERQEPLAPDERELIAVHEAGHALLASLLHHADRPRKVSIIPRGRALGITEQLADEERHNHTYDQLADRLVVLLAGRVAVELVFRERTTGAEDDLRKATSLARCMVTRWGMSELGPLGFAKPESQMWPPQKASDFSPDTGRRIDAEVRRLLKEAESRADSTLRQHRNLLDRLTKELLQHETMDGDTIAALLERDEVTTPPDLSKPEQVPQPADAPR